MKLCHIVPSLQEQHGGPSKSVRALCQAFARLGHTTELFSTAPDAPRRGTELREGNGLCIRVFRRQWPERLCVSAGLRRGLLANRCDVVHHHALWLRTLHYSRLAARRGDVPLVVSPRGMMNDWAWRHHHWRKQVSRHVIHPGAFESVDGWHATSRQEENDIRALGFREPICVAPNGVDAPTPLAIERSAVHWREACPEAKQRPVALFYGRFHQKKRVIELIDLWLETAPPEWLLLLVGLPEEYTPEQLERYALKMSGAGRVRAFPGGNRPPPYAIASLFLLPSHSENFGLTVAESMAYGVPALVTDTTPWQALNANGCGWCVRWPDYPAALRAATAEPAAALAERGRRAQAWVVRDFAWDRTAAELAGFYESLRKVRAS